MLGLAIDLGSHTTKIYMTGCGVVLTEATCLAVEQTVEEGEVQVRIKAFGDKARALYGKAAKSTHIVNPVVEGEIINEELTEELLRYFLEKVEVTSKNARKIEVLYILPCSYTEELKETYQRISTNLGIGRVYFTQVSYCTLLANQAVISRTSPLMSVDIGYGVTSMAVLSQDGIITGYTLNLGSGNIDVHIMDLIAENYRLRVGSLTAERLKNSVGSLLEDDNKTLAVDGTDLLSGSPTAMAFSSSQLYGVITLYVDKLIEYIHLMICNLPSEVASSVVRNGIYLSGGICKMDGLIDYIGQKLKLAINVTEEPHLSSVIGGGMILSADAYLESMTTQD